MRIDLHVPGLKFLKNSELRTENPGLMRIDLHVPGLKFLVLSSEF
jgi:hypothetical protein